MSTNPSLPYYLHMLFSLVHVWHKYCISSYLYSMFMLKQLKTLSSEKRVFCSGLAIETSHIISTNLRQYKLKDKKKVITFEWNVFFHAFWHYRQLIMSCKISRGSLPPHSANGCTGPWSRSWNTEIKKKYKRIIIQ